MAEKQEGYRKVAVRAIAAGAAVGLLRNEADAVKLAVESERPTNRRITFEPGIHISEPEVRARFNKGDLNANVWMHDPQLTRRLASYAPQMLAVDGLFPTPQGASLDKEWIWKIVPRPREVNPLGFYAVAGDPDYLSIEADLKGVEGAADIDEPGQHLQYLIAELDVLGDTSASDALHSTKRFGVGLLIGAGILAAGGAAVRFAPERGPTRKRAAQERILSRRFILQAGAAGAGALATRGLWDIASSASQENGPTKASQARTESQKNFWQNFNNYMGDIPEDIFVDGRTALLIAKHEDAMNYLQENQYITTQAKGAIVMGNAHDYKSERFMQDKQARDQAIREYARHIIGLADRLSFEYFHFSKQQRVQLTQHLLQYLSAIDITHVSDPGLPPGGDKKAYVHDNVRPVVSLKSKQVENALARVNYENALKLTNNS